MEDLLKYPFDAAKLKRKRKAILKELMNREGLTEKRIAILGGSTTHDIMETLELFLLDQGIRPVFFESEYAQYWQDTMFGNETLRMLQPDVIFIHTSMRNITEFPSPSSSKDEIEAMLSRQYGHFSAMWDKLIQDYRCPIIQNNFEYPFYRLMGNKDASDPRGRVNFVTRLNALFNDYANSHEQFYINDINYQSADYGLERWADPFCWHMYKYALALDAIPVLAFNVSNIIKSIFGKNKKALALDLDNTLWGGIVGDDGPEGLILGQETSMGQVFSEFQQYLKSLQRQGILLNIISKNEKENAMAGLKHPQMLLHPDDFISIKANWEPKSVNLVHMAEELSLLPESFVFVDDNPAEREIIRRQVPGAAVPELLRPEQYIRAIDHAGYFEVTTFSADDLKRNEMYKENASRAQLLNSFENYEDYLISLRMTAQIRPFEPIYMARIAQLTNKSNQFNLTTRRYTQEEIELAASDPSVITLYGKLEDCFGDNGVVSIVIAENSSREEKAIDIILWLMSCRVLKRDMEFAMMDELAKRAAALGKTKIFGYYYPTAKNAMVKDFYAKQGFTKLTEDEIGNSVWEFNLDAGYINKNHVIEVEGV
ncbi:MAG: HAD family hydrolase [Clostridia bacterium]|nr:HAD family hydrolase [Clostridia bacterium]